MVQEIESFHAEDEIQPLIDGKTTLDRGVEGVEARSSYEVPSERALPNGKASSRISRYKSKCSWIQPPVSRDGLTIYIGGTPMQIDRNAGN